MSVVLISQCQKGGCDDTPVATRLYSTRALYLHTALFYAKNATGRRRAEVEREREVWL